MPPCWVNAQPSIIVPGLSLSLATGTSSRTHFSDGGQVADSQPLGRAVLAPVDHVLAPVRAVAPASARVPLQHQLPGRIERVDINISKQRVARADLELASGVVEEPLIEPLAVIPQGRLPLETG